VTADAEFVMTAELFDRFKRDQELFQDRLKIIIDKVTFCAC
jgi:hypothetical protein